MGSRKGFRLTVVIALVAAFGIGASVFATASGGTPEPVRGGGTTFVRGGTGAPSFAPVITRFAFSWRAGSGGFECLALAPSPSAGNPGSGDFDTNVMYVTGSITSASVVEGVLLLKGTATVTGVGAGSDQRFTVNATRGGPGATLTLKVSGLTFKEIVTDGAISF